MLHFLIFTLADPFSIQILSFSCRFEQKFCQMIGGKSWICNCFMCLIFCFILKKLSRNSNSGLILSMLSQIISIVALHLTFIVKFEITIWNYNSFNVVSNYFHCSITSDLHSAHRPLWAVWKRWWRTETDRSQSVVNAFPRSGGFLHTMWIPNWCCC